jgi:lipopolysaccharide transport system ATP-binding protein
MPAITVTNLSKQYRLGAQMHDTLRDQIAGLFRGGERREPQQFWALKDVSFEIEKGDIVGVIGRNGAGKSTLLKILSQITEPTEGEVRIRGRIASLLEVGTGFHPELSGRENVFLNGAILGMTRAEIARKFQEIATFAEMDTFLDTPVKHYSSGMTTRLAFAVAAHLEPEILIIDEVLAVGDAAFQKKCLGKMGEVARAGRTVIFVSHNMAAVTALCRRGIYLEQGRLKAIGPIQEITEHYLRDALPSGGKSGFRQAKPRGSGAVRFTDLTVGAGGIAGAAVCGEPMKVRFAYEADQDPVAAQFVVNIYDGQQLRLLSLDSFTDTRLPQLYPRVGAVEIEIPADFSFTPGRYTVELASLVNGEVGDHVPGALEFEVRDGDFFGNGRKSCNTSALLVKSQWMLEPPASAGAMP